MNELIEHLAERTVFEMDQDEFHEDMIIPDAYLEKFAELIIKECVQKCQTDWYGDSLDDICVKMKAHFAVE